MRLATVGYGMHKMVVALMRCVKAMGDVVLLIVLWILILSVVATQLYAGSMRQKCVWLPTVGGATTWGTGATDYTTWTQDSAHYISDRNSLTVNPNPSTFAYDTNEVSYQGCGNASTATHCDSTYTTGGVTYNVECLAVGENFNLGLMSFDNVGASALTVFQVMTLDFWEDAYHFVLAANGKESVAWFFVMIYFGAFFLLNLVLAVVAVTYAEQRSKDSLAHQSARRIQALIRGHLERKRHAIRKLESKQRESDRCESKEMVNVQAPPTTAQSNRESVENENASRLESMPEHRNTHVADKCGSNEESATEKDRKNGKNGRHQQVGAKLPKSKEKSVDPALWIFSGNRKSDGDATPEDYQATTPPPMRPQKAPTKIQIARIVHVPSIVSLHRTVSLSRLTKMS